MKNLIVLTFGLLLSQATFAVPAELYINVEHYFEGPKWMKVQDYIKESSIDMSDEEFCFKGNPAVVSKKMMSWHKDTREFFCGCDSSGYKLIEIKTSAKKIKIKLEDMVAGGYRFIQIDPCTEI